MSINRKMKSKTKGMIAGSAALTMLATNTISGLEGRELKAYYDIVGVATICDGETKGVKIGDVATPQECDDMLAKNIRLYEEGLDNCLFAAMPGETKVAILSWAYNVGLGAACRSTLVRVANSGDLVGMCNQLRRWTYAAGLFVRGLYKRRSLEREMCLEGLAAGEKGLS